LAGTDAYTDDDVRRLQQVAGPYLLDASEHDPPVYRLYYQALAYHLRAQYPDAVVAQQRITQTLLGLVPRDADGRRNWSVAHPYIQAHLAAHAAAPQLDDPFADR
jgi:hypothetical protein